MAIADGTARVLATPHVRLLEIGELSPRTRELSARLREAGLPLEVRAGGELAPDDVGPLTDAELEALASGPPARRWLLLEAPLGPMEPGLGAAAEELRQRGFAVLIGHPERSPQTTRAELREQTARGSMLQINASSVVGVHGEAAKRAALGIAASGMPFILASDAHSPARPPLLTDASRVLAAAGFDAAAIRAAVDTGPARLLDDGLADRDGTGRAA
jgi:protein-tyrosine phosphatase